jgi:tRNA A37 threonylcarbamoyladenosine modification protein TsaB
MGLVLAIDASSMTYAVAAGTGAEPSAQSTGRRKDPEFAGIGGLAAQTLTAVNATFQDISLIAVDAGPGGLSSIRAAVAYANGLAFSLGAKIFAIGSLELMAIAARADHQGPLLILKPGQGGDVYAGLFIDAENPQLRCGPPGTVVPELAAGLTAVHVAGLPTEDMASMLPGVTVTDTGIADASVVTLYQAAQAAIGTPELLVPAAVAINEASPQFHQIATNRI